MTWDNIGVRVLGLATSCVIVFALAPEVETFSDFIVMSIIGGLTTAAVMITASNFLGKKTLP